MGFPRGFADEVRNQVDIVRIVSDYVSLKKRGANWVACCPFHSEKTPSFNVHPGKQIFRCFGCNVGGDVFSFVMQIERCSFPEALKLVAERSGIPIPQFEESEDHKQAARDRDELLQIMQWAATFFEGNLGAGSEGREARSYLERRGIREETRKLMRIGYAPQSWDALSSYLRKHGVSNYQLERSGLVTAREGGSGFYDRFRGRIIFPIADVHGRIIAFGGRIIGEGEPKYLNSPETELYSKGRNLFGLNYAKEAIRKQDFAILVEGYLDFVIPYQEGVQNLIASLGTALTEQQVKLLARYTRRIVVNFDPDSAGISATKRSIEMLLNEGFKVNVLTLPEGDDPDTYVLKNGAHVYRRLLTVSQPFLDYIIEQSVREHDTTKPAGKVETLNSILPYLNMVRDRVERSEYASHVADRLKIEDRIVREELKRAAMSRAEQIDARKIRLTSEITPAEKRLLTLIVNNGAIRASILSQIDESDFSGLRTESIFRALLELEKTATVPNYANLSQYLTSGSQTDEELVTAILPLILIGGDELEEEDRQVLHQEAARCLNAIRRKQIQQSLELLQVEIRQAEVSGDARKFFELSQRKLTLRRELESLSD